ncbi:CG7164, partial [Drosophila busckii]
KNFANQRRIREVLLQKSVLENMLLQHKRLQRDRQTIALDIQRMRQDLDKIKNKLDTSIQALNSTRTMYNGMSKS